MNSDEGMSMAKMAVTVLLVVLVIGAVVGIVYAAYSWFGSGTQKLTDNVNGISDTMLSNYDDTTVTGDDVLAALKNFRNGETGVWISNFNNRGGASGGGGAVAKAEKTNGTKVKCLNYCSMAEDFTPHAVGELVVSTIGNNGDQWSVKSLQMSESMTVKNTDFSPTTTSSDKIAYVKKSAKWYANLVYDQSTGAVVGVLFQQIS